jgi:hypothetical protein
MGGSEAAIGFGLCNKMADLVTLVRKIYSSERRVDWTLNG